MQELALAGDLIAMLAAAAVSVGIPPGGSGAFWTIMGIYGVVSILFDDETPRGIPGIEYLHSRHPSAANGRN